ncbi:MAG: hypothetical protein KBD53_05885 [Candidatus Omnitrophica bacterium]|nr:hypothetical protein [Candidatus Omnitrophota bacterium]
MILNQLAFSFLETDFVLLLALRAQSRCVTHGWAARRPSDAGIIFMHCSLKFHDTEFLRQRFSFGNDLNIVFAKNE